MIQPKATTARRVRTLAASQPRGDVALAGPVRKRRVPSTGDPSASRPRTSRALCPSGEAGARALKTAAGLWEISDDEVAQLLSELRRRRQRGLDPEDPSSSESEPEAEPSSGMPARTRTPPPRVKKALEALLEARTLPDFAHLTAGEHAAVRPRTEAQYAQEVAAFRRFANAEKLIDIPVTDLDDLLVSYMDHQIRQGVSAARGMKLIAGVVHGQPKVGKNGPHTLSRSWRALKGWQNLCPSTSRLPEAWPIWCALVNGLVMLGRFDMALFICLMWSTYARPIQLMALEPEYLYPPSRVATFWTVQLNPEVEGVPSKAKEFDVTIELDHDWWPRLAPMLDVLRGLPRGRRAWEFGYPKLAATVQKVARGLGFDLVVCQARHSGASSDMATRKRTLPEVKKRGGWKADRSVVRYEKGARLSSTWARHPRWLQDHAERCEEKFVEILLHGLTVPNPVFTSL